MSMEQRNEQNKNNNNNNNVGLCRTQKSLAGNALSKTITAFILMLCANFIFAANASGQERIFNLNIKNGMNYSIGFLLIGGQCYEGEGVNNPGKVLYIPPLAPGAVRTVTLARVQGNGCDGRQGFFDLRPQNFNRANDNTPFNFNNSGALTTGVLPTNYHGVLSEKSVFDGSYTWTMLPNEQRLKQKIDQRLTRPRNTISSTSGVWERIDVGTTAVHDRFSFDNNGFFGNFFQKCFGKPLFHPQHVQRLADKDGKAYFMVSQSRGHNGNIYVVETNPGILDAQTGRLRPNQFGGSSGRIIWEQVFTGSFNGNINPIGNWNHPGKMTLIDGVLVVTAQNWSEGTPGVDLCTGSTRNPYNTGDSEDALLFFDVRDPAAPKYWGKMSATELQIPQSTERNGAFEQGRDSMVSVVSIWRTEDGKYAMNTGGRRQDTDNYSTWETNAISPYIGDWTKRDEHEYTSGEYGDDFESYQAFAPGDRALVNMTFDMTNAGAGAGVNDGFAFRTISSETNNPYLEVWNLGLDDDESWIAASHHATRKGEPLVYNVRNYESNRPEIWQVHDSRNAIDLPQPDREVQNANDSGPGSLREAIGYGGKITFHPRLDGGTLFLTGGPLVVSLYDVEIDASSLQKGFSISGNYRSRAFHVTKGNKATLKSLTVKQGLNRATTLPSGVSDNHVLFGGGGILNEGTLILDQTTVMENVSDADGGGIFNSGTMTLLNTTVANNFSAAQFFNGNIIANGTDGGGGGISNAGLATLIHSSITYNTDFGVGVGGIKTIGTGLTIDNSIIAINNPFGGGNLQGSYRALGANIINSVEGSSRISGPVPILAPTLELQGLGYYGGLTPTMPPRSASSPAIDSAVTTANTSLIGAKDQRGLARPNGGAFDIGAVEVYSETIVTSPFGAGPGTLAEAIATTSSGAMITFDSSLNGKVIKLGGNPLLINKKVTISDTGLPDGVTISGENASNIFVVFSAQGELNIDGLTLTGGRAPNGGALVADNGAIVTMKGTTLTGNNATESGGAIINRDSTVDLTQVTISDNTAGDFGGAIYTLSTVNDEDAGTILFKSTVSGNVSGKHGGALFSENSFIATTSSTIAYNMAEVGHNGGGIYIDGGRANITTSIIADNQAGTGNGPDIFKVLNSGATFRPFRSLIGNNNSVEAEFPAGSPNQFNDIVNVSAMLGTLNDNGGPTETIPLLWDSPAIDFITSIGGTGTDARDFPRPSGAGTDIGAYELQWLDSDGDGLIDAQEIALGSNPNNADSDEDGMPDGYELANGQNLSLNDSVLDLDADGLTNLEEFNLGSDPGNADSDGDGVLDGSDVYVLFAIGDLIDTDNDGAPDECDNSCLAQGMRQDLDDDNDGVPDLIDAFPLDSTRFEIETTNAKNDVDGDGKSDLLWRSNARGWNFLWAMNGTQTKLARPINVVQDDGWLMAGQGDYDGDGKSDILWRNTITGLNFMYLMDGLTIKTRRVLNYVDAPQWELAGSGDFNGDGKGDVLWHDVERGRTQLYLMDGLAINTNRPLAVVTDLNEKIVAVGDVNGDGTDDVIWRNQANGNNSIWLMENGLVTDMYVLNRSNLDWTIAGAGDLDGDGTDDIVLRNQVDGRNYAFMMENGQIRVSQLINTVSLDWQIANMGDFDGDGKTDFLWRNEAAARNIVHLMDGVTIKDRGVLRPTDNTWTLAK